MKVRPEPSAEPSCAFPGCEKDITAGRHHYESFENESVYCHPFTPAPVVKLCADDCPMNGGCEVCRSPAPVAEEATQEMPAAFRDAWMVSRLHPDDCPDDCLASARSSWYDWPGDFFRAGAVATITRRKTE